MEPRQITRWEVARFAREAYDLGVRVIGGCCGFESYHIRAMAEELAEERGGLPEGSKKSDHDLSTLKKKAELGRPDFALKYYFLLKTLFISCLKGKQAVLEGSCASYRAPHVFCSVQTA